MKILYIAGNPDGASTLEIEAEVNALQRQIDDPQSSEPIDFRVYSSIRVDELASVISRAAPDILHFAAHGEDDAIVLAHRDHGQLKLRGDDLADLLEALDLRPRLVVVNACDSATMASRIARAADFVIGTDAPISNDGARAMAATLYQRLARSAAIGAAFRASETMLRIVDAGAVRTRLYPEDASAEALRSRLTEPLRILACLPELETALDKHRTAPGKNFSRTQPQIQFGVAGAPATSTQLVFFTDDETVKPTHESETLEALRSWIMETAAVRGELWTEPWYRYYGDMQWYASVVTADRKVLSTVSTTCEALERFYFEECWRGDLPIEMKKAVEDVLLQLAANDGARRGRRWKRPFVVPEG